jgi:hypothetical protein
MKFDFDGKEWVQGQQAKVDGARRFLITTIVVLATSEVCALWFLKGAEWCRIWFKPFLDFFYLS